MTPPANGNPPDLEDRMRALTARYSRAPMEELTAGYRLTPVGGWSSLSALQLLAAVEAEYGLSLDLPAYLRIATLGELVEHVRCRLRERAADGGGPR